MSSFQTQSYGTGSSANINELDGHADGLGEQGLVADKDRMTAQWQAQQAGADFQANRNIRNIARNIAMDMVQDEMAFAKKANEKYSGSATP